VFRAARWFLAYCLRMVLRLKKVVKCRVLNWQKMVKLKSMSMIWA